MKGDRRAVAAEEVASIINFSHGQMGEMSVVWHARFYSYRPSACLASLHVQINHQDRI